MNERYTRNHNTLTLEDDQRLAGSKVCVVGCGGLGGYVIEMLARIGVGEITAIDGDVFDVTNLNRQLLSSEKLLGKEKAQAAKQRMTEVNSTIKVNAINAFLNKANAAKLIQGHNIVIDALDNMESRKTLVHACAKKMIPMVHGAIAGWYGQVAVIPPGSDLLDQIYPDGSNKGEETELGNPSFTPATIASLQVAECIKILLGKENALINKMLTIDLLNQEYEVLEI